MKNICVIGALGKLGSSLMKHPNAIECPWQFEDKVEELDEWLAQHTEIDTVWHVARTCRTTGIRRDAETFLLDHGGLLKILSTRAKIADWFTHQVKLFMAWEETVTTRMKCYLPTRLHNILMMI